jgi:glycosyltransferase involved in cell wall biosynthesis
LEYRAVKRIPQFVSNSLQGARFLIDKLKVSPARVVVINNGVNSLAPKMGPSAWRDRLEIDEQTFVACMVANLHKNKDHQTLLRAWRDVVTSLEENGRNAVLLLAGRYDDSHESLVALSRELSITNSVRFLGHVSDIAGLLGAVDISILSSRSEGCPNGILESMACGLAVAGTDTTGIKETLGPAGASLLAQPGDSKALAEIILRLANDPGLCSRIGAANQDRARSEYGAVSICQQTVSLLLSLIERQV